jgi:hypothetical protein
VLQWGRQNTEFAVTIGFYPDGAPGEVFISGAKAGSDVDAAIRDNAILISLGLQHGVPLKVMQGAMTRERNGEASTVAGRVVDMVSGGS